MERPGLDKQAEAVAAAAATRHGRWREPGAPREPGISRLARIPTLENGEPLVDLLEVAPEVDCPARPSFVRATVAEMVLRAARSLPPVIRLRVTTALRTREQQERGYWGHYEKLREARPDWPRAVLRREANRFWHPPDTPSVPGHCTGGAVDVTLLDSDGEPLDVTSTVRPVPSTHPTHLRYLTETARANRLLLLAAMSGAGFSNCADEWWHWSYGDTGWAGRIGAEYAVYGWVTDLPPLALEQGVAAMVGAPRPEDRS